MLLTPRDEGARSESTGLPYNDAALASRRFAKKVTRGR